ncbi:hypothetical protein MUP01_00400 [Candidatus Bathyarchaeota archaeon]|nr:hypothetical protein [Candidatus Bathyarchaeota archaeon]
MNNASIQSAWFEMVQVAGTKDLAVGFALLLACFVIAFYVLGYTSASAVVSKEFALNTEYLGMIVLVMGVLSGLFFGRFIESENSKKKTPKSQTNAQFF